MLLGRKINKKEGSYTTYLFEKGIDKILKKVGEECTEVIIAGKEKKDRILSPMEKRVVAFHEVGHALVSALQKDSEPVQKITIVPRTMGALGYTLQTPEEEKYLEKAGKEYVSAFIELKVSPQIDEGFDAIAAKIYEYPEVKSVYLMSGGFDLAVTIHIQNIGVLIGGRQLHAGHGRNVLLQIISQNGNHHKTADDHDQQNGGHRAGNDLQRSCADPPDCI